LATPARAASYADAIVAQLSAQGFADVLVDTTWLGRVRIVATRSDGVREIILNPRTGEILRDLWTTAQGQTAYSLIDPVGSKGAPASGDLGQSTSSDGRPDVADSDKGSQDTESQDPPDDEDPPDPPSGDDPAYN